MQAQWAAGRLGDPPGQKGSHPRSPRSATGSPGPELRLRVVVRRIEARRPSCALHPKPTALPIAPKTRYRAWRKRSSLTSKVRAASIKNRMARCAAASFGARLLTSRAPILLEQGSISTNGSRRTARSTREAAHDVFHWRLDRAVLDHEGLSALGRGAGPRRGAHGNGLSVGLLPRRAIGRQSRSSRPIRFRSARS